MKSTHLSMEKIMEAKDYDIRILVNQIKGELEYIEHYAKKQREKLEELEKLLNNESSRH